MTIGTKNGQSLYQTLIIWINHALLYEAGYIAIASIKTVSRLFMIEDKNAAIKPIPMTLLNKP